MAKEIMKRLRMDNATIEKVCILVKYHDLRPEPAKRAVKRAVVKVSRELFGLFLQVQQADLLAQGNYLREEKQKTLNRVKQIYEEILEEGDCLTLKELALSGKDLLEAGMKSGKAMGDTLKRLLEHVLENPQDNKKEILLKLAEQWKEN